MIIQSNPRRQPFIFNTYVKHLCQTNAAGDRYDLRIRHINTQQINYKRWQHFFWTCHDFPHFEDACHTVLAKGHFLPVSYK